MVDTRKRNKIRVRMVNSEVPCPREGAEERVRMEEYILT